ncbi:TPA: DUF826 domain-containing protein [Escherichia coli]|nr:DUF826 domain-containing protein [Escherichia coli]
MAEAKTAVTGLVTDDVLKQALATREVLNPLKMAVKKVLSEQIDKEVENILASLTGQTVQNADAAVDNTGENIMRDENADKKDNGVTKTGNDEAADADEAQVADNNPVPEQAADAAQAEAPEDAQDTGAQAAVQAQAADLMQQ